MLSNTTRLNEVDELRTQLKEYLYLYFLTKEETYKCTIGKINESIKSLESIINSSHFGSSDNLSDS